MYCNAKERYLIVPHRDFNLFKKKSPSEFNILIENDLLNPNIIKNNIADESRDRYGWFYQQILKIECAKLGSPDDINIIWDADTVALRNFNFVENGKIFYRSFDHHHEAYFDTIKFLLNIEKSYDKSFIAQVFPLKVKWLTAMIFEIEDKFQIPWYLALLSIKNPMHKLFFSEYETIGNYINLRFTESILIKENAPWYRDGGKSIKRMKDYNLNFLKKEYPYCDYVAVESYNVLEAMNFFERLKYRIIVRATPYFI